MNIQWGGAAGDDAADGIMRDRRETLKALEKGVAAVTLAGVLSALWLAFTGSHVALAITIVLAAAYVRYGAALDQYEANTLAMVAEARARVLEAGRGR